ncbi:ankyrin [Plenodomus tracheiphilus IPT5]|uniref:Ankyrin n=1 Tax=Plenodomus tracheiphilus IPT5 TaxID=1408161 RepID=A0A6A7AYA5_9PLEO|nr:ankyrin [Plenodomus tracheiphilus IPT5]
MHDARSPSLVGSQQYFLALAEEFSEVFVVFDALDECPEQKRQGILEFITEVVTFVRNHVPTVQILAENVAADIESFARSKVEELQAKKMLYVTKDELKEQIVQTLATKAEGMFLWVNLQLDSLCQASKVQRDQAVEEALKSLPHDLTDTYVRILDRIERQGTSMRDLALNCLAWTIYARRPLSTQELQHALAIESKCKAQQELQFNSTQVILEACGNLLEEANGRIRPIHHTVQEFFTATVQKTPQHPMQTQLLDSSSTHRQLGLACLAYIDQMAFSAPAPESFILSYQLQANVLAGYACQSFDYHISNCDEPSVDVTDRLEKLFQQESRYLAAILQIKTLRDSNDYCYSNIRQRFNDMAFPVTPGTIMYSTSLYNIATLSQRWIDQTPPMYALHLAASAGLTSAVSRLLKGGCDIDEKDRSGSTPLYYTSLNDHLDILQSLLNGGADGGYYGNALQAASYRGHEQVVKMLLDAGARQSNEDNLC